MALGACAGHYFYIMLLFSVELKMKKSLLMKL
jgi:hypothetical protein